MTRRQLLDELGAILAAHARGLAAFGAVGGDHQAARIEMVEVEARLIRLLGSLTSTPSSDLEDTAQLDLRDLDLRSSGAGEQTASLGLAEALSTILKMHAQDMVYLLQGHDRLAARGFLDVEIELVKLSDIVHSVDGEQADSDF